MSKITEVKEEVTEAFWDICAQMTMTMALKCRVYRKHGCSQAGTMICNVYDCPIQDNFNESLIPK